MATGSPKMIFGSLLPKTRQRGVKMKRVAYYARVSTSRQEQEATIDSQIAEIEGKIKEDGNILMPNLKFIDNGWSGDLLARPDLDRMRDAARKNEFDALYVYDRGRLARRFTYQEIILEEVTELGIEFITLHDLNAVTAEEKVLQSMQGVFHEYERVKIAERMRRGKLGKTRDGKLLGYNPLYGLNYIAKTKDHNGSFVIDQTEAEVVRKIFNWVANDGYSVRKVIKKLYELKIYPQKHKREFWTRGPVIRLLKNETYIGKHYYNKTESVVPKKPKDSNGGYKKIKKSSRKERPKDQWILFEECPAIIDEETFYKVQSQLGLNKKYASRNKKYNYLLGGLIKCTCGVTRVGQKGGNHLYYRCADRIYNYPLPPKCHEGSINVEMLDNLVWTHLLKLLNNQNLLEKQAEQWLQSQQISNTVEDVRTDSVKVQLSKLDEEERKYLQAFGAGLASFEVYEKQMKDLKDRKQMLNTEIVEQKSVKNQANFLSGLNIKELCRKVFEKFNLWDFSKKEQLLRKIIDKVIASQEFAIVQGHLPIEYKELNVALQPIGRHRRPA